ncbi:MAG: mannose-1-phosphate guanylyltransferase [Sulfurimonas sp. RIFOXYD12_FULL_33_39]|uniref:N-acetylmuramate alpha-1-phosphate uridylyltransferase MurU n=1 Tax=unclassified Sulfurimonas TaxID=2623549 RepID=UPI0008D240B5|nr:MULTISPECIES: nucleotidyltransferase family protein [unclassified Sulfurimonas]OHE10971.1 MAG: mannose-1-phosphate guanylyltransferase [Sulfurimonas sp. RIFOXYD12_FULL_33_39]OHE13260.1 MAG: mannose-1-phosphate guanylyltransferase [Sulfurimonas sp. RIFOXYD2_FULL_34_21]
MKAMILAAGRGERMRPLTDKIPKPLLKVHGKSLIVWHIEKLAYLGFSEIVINIDYLGDKIIEALSDGSAWGVSITYSDERQSGALESAGGIIKALPFMGKDTFLVVNSDVWCDYEFDFNFDLKDDLAHLILVPNPQHNPEGDFGLSKERVTNDSNKKSTFSGIGYYSPKLFENIEMQKTPLAPILREAANNKRVGGSLYLGEWHDIGTPQRLKDIQN